MQELRGSRPSFPPSHRDPVQSFSSFPPSSHCDPVKEILLRLHLASDDRAQRGAGASAGGARRGPAIRRPRRPGRPLAPPPSVFSLRQAPCPPSKRVLSCPHPSPSISSSRSLHIPTSKPHVRSPLCWATACACSSCVARRPALPQPPRPRICGPACRPWATTSSQPPLPQREHSAMWRRWLKRATFTTPR